MSMLELYHAHRSTCSQKVRICLAELGLEFRSRPINLIAGEQLTPAYLAVNPNGVVPALMHDGAAILESSVICEYLSAIPLRRLAVRLLSSIDHEVGTSWSLPGASVAQRGNAHSPATFPPSRLATQTCA
jgi:hypothetical protein